MNPAIVVRSLGKKYFRYHLDRPRTIMDAMLSGWRHMKSRTRFWALKDIDFTVNPGQILGVIGNNGAGKSTLLRLLGGIGRPDRGHISIKGRLGALLDLGAGLHPDLSGRENLYLNAVVLGLTRKEVTTRLETIVDFAELQEFIDSPVRTYSTGMKMRLAFAISIHTDASILLIDEHLSVGDKSFQSKCLDRIFQLKKDGIAAVFISHNIGQVKKLSDQVMWLHQGVINALGEPSVVLDQYKSNQSPKPQQMEVFPTSEIVEIKEVRFTNKDSVPISKIRSGDPLNIAIECKIHQPIQAIRLMLTLTNKDNDKFLKTNKKIKNASMQSPTTLNIQLFVDRLDLASGSYYVNVNIYNEDWSKTLDQRWHVHELLISSDSNGNGIIDPPHQWKIMEIKNL